MSINKYAYASELNWKEKAERKIYAQMMRKVIALRGRTTVLKVEGESFEQIEIDTLTDDDLRPENGYYLFGHCPPITGMLQKIKGRTTKALSFREDENGQEWAVLKVQWTAKACIPVSALTEEQATALNAELVEMENHPNHYLIPSLPFDFSDVAESYNWNVIQNNEPVWKVEEE